MQYLQAIKNAKSDKELSAIISKIYEDGKNAPIDFEARLEMSKEQDMF